MGGHWKGVIYHVIGMRVWGAWKERREGGRRVSSEIFQEGVLLV